MAKISVRANKRINLGSLGWLNLSRSGASLTLGKPGLSVNIGKSGTYLNLGMPGTGISTRTKLEGIDSVKSQIIAKRELNRSSTNRRTRTTP